MNHLTTKIVLVISMLMTGLLIHFIAGMKRRRRLLSVHLGRDAEEKDLAGVRRTLWVNGVCTVLGIVLVLASEDPTLSFIGVILGTSVSPYWLVGESIALVVRSKKTRVPGRYKVLLDEDRPTLWDYASAPLQAFNAAIIAGSTALFAALLPHLGERIPAHWDMHGNVNRTGSPNELWILFFLLLYDTLVMFFVFHGLSKERWALPTDDADRYLVLATDRRRYIARLIEWMMVGINLSMAIIWIGMAAHTLPGYDWTVSVATVGGTVVMMIAAVGPLLAYLPRLTKINDEMVEIAGEQALGTREDGWKLKGTFYYCPSDPAVYVPRRRGIGMTMNFARAAAWGWMSALLLLPCVPIALLALFA